MRGILAAALMFVAARPVLSAQGDPNLRRIQALLTKPAVMCGRFEQAKTLVGLRRPVRSSGRFCVVLEKGVLWTTVLPFPSTLRLSKDEIVESHGAQVTKRLSAREEPTVGIINDLLFSLLQGDLARLTASFAITSTVNDREWSAKLVPRDGGMKHVIGGIELSGGAFVRQITIREASGDATEISFSGVATGPAALLPEESRQFELPAAGTAHPGVHER
ncbi:MAG: LolA family protein [Gemmatimonadaceae bacterium]